MSGQGAGILSGNGAAIMSGGQGGFQGFNSGSGALGVDAKITINLEDVCLHEQKISAVLEVSNRIITA